MHCQARHISSSGQNKWKSWINKMIFEDDQLRLSVRLCRRNCHSRFVHFSLIDCCCCCCCLALESMLTHHMRKQKVLDWLRSVERIKDAKLKHRMKPYTSLISSCQWGTLESKPSHIKFQRQWLPHFKINVTMSVCLPVFYLHNNNMQGHKMFLLATDFAENYVCYLLFYILAQVRPK